MICKKHTTKLIMLSIATFLIVFFICSLFANASEPADWENTELVEHDNDVVYYIDTVTDDETTQYVTQIRAWACYNSKPYLYISDNNCVNLLYAISGYVNPINSQSSVLEVGGYTRIKYNTWQVNNVQSVAANYNILANSNIYVCNGNMYANSACTVLLKKLNTNIPIFATYSDALGYANGTKTIQDAINYNATYDPSTGTFIPNPPRDYANEWALPVYVNTSGFTRDIQAQIHSSIASISQLQNTDYNSIYKIVFIDRVSIYFYFSTSPFKIDYDTRIYNTSSTGDLVTVANTPIYYCRKSTLDCAILDNGLATSPSVQFRNIQLLYISREVPSVNNQQLICLSDRRPVSTIPDPEIEELASDIVLIDYLDENDEPNDILRAIKNTLIGIKNLTTNFQAFISAFVQFTKTLWDKLSQTIVDTMMTPITDIIDKIVEIKEKITELIETVIDNAINTTVELLPDNVITMMDNIYSLGTDGGRNPEFSILTMMGGVCRFLFIPDDEYMDMQINTLKSRFPFIEQMEDLVYAIKTSLLNVVPSPPVIIIRAGTYGFINLQSDYQISFEWFEVFKPYTDAFLVVFIYIGFGFRVYSRLGEIINGSGLNFSDITTDTGGLTFRHDIKFNGRNVSSRWENKKRK